MKDQHILKRMKISRKKAKEMYLDWVNNFLSPEDFGNYYGLSESIANEFLIWGYRSL